ncbi:hypothetical protein H696_01693 [Fonticula alba]|uniref:Small ribosomal subunit protein uS4 N-terminal domain-containing protein n=1 Tax=Fonticula alba TaxID=691883 RepID=A0A058ZEC4_FONAL|nr:hypothetical protein H696_01693 [Fonticula alba]KCV72296.1 hypothetical protein H696_01693 [Fonticula alba]|eukprot:XP_009493874.1 hypothetical protein H696_01693 [Fonticula alba]
MSSMRKLKYHEQKLLKKVNFVEWKSDGGHREAAVMRRYHIQDREDYIKATPMLASSAPVPCLDT